MDADGEQEFQVPREIFTGDDLYSIPTIITAAKHPDSRILKAIIKKSHFEYLSIGGHPQTGWWCSPLTAAIAANLPTNVRLLLEAGAPPIGTDLEFYQFYALYFIRFRNWKTGSICYEDVDLVWEKSPGWYFDQSWPLTRFEIEARYHGFSHFFTEVELVDLNRVPGGETMHALNAAAKLGDINIFNMVYRAGAEASFWLLPEETYVIVPEELPQDEIDHKVDFFGWIAHARIDKQPAVASAAAVTTPLHIALSEGNLGLAKHLLDLGFDPNCQPLCLRTQCMTPLMKSLSVPGDENFAAFEMLATHPAINFNTLTPVYGIHVLHCVVSLHSVALIEKAAKLVSLASAPRTALGHSLFHIGCLPLDDLHVQSFSQKISQSIHEIRTLDYAWERTWLIAHTDTWNDYHWYEKRPQYKDKPLTKEIYFPEPDPVFLGPQMEIIQYLIRECQVDLSAQDVHGNTGLHYLAGHRVINQPLIDLLRGTDGGEKVWETSRNRWGHTPKDLYEDGLTIVEEPHKPWFSKTGPPMPPWPCV